MQIEPVRLIVTGTDERGRACVTSDELVGDAFHRQRRPVALTDLWQIASVPTDVGAEGRRPATQPFKLAPDQGGVKLRVVQFDPESSGVTQHLDGLEVFSEMGAADEHVANARHPYMHRTRSVDFGIVLRGSITLLLDEEDVEVSAGDVVVQRGTNHAWSNRWTEPCIVAFVLVDATAPVRHADMRGAEAAALTP